MAIRIGIVDTGVNPWHSHVRGKVSGCRIYVAPDGSVHEDGDFRDLVGHGTAVAGVIREAFADAHIFAVRVFDSSTGTYPSLVARAILLAAAHDCRYVNLSVSIPPTAGHALMTAACAAATATGCVLVASACADRPGWMPASLPGVYAVVTDDSLAIGEVRERGPMQLAAPGRPRDLEFISKSANFHGTSFACPRGLVHLAQQSSAAPVSRRTSTVSV